MANELIKLVKPGISGDLKSYWAMHFCAVFETLYEHKYLEYSFQRDIPNTQPKTLANLDAYTEQSFLARIRNNLHNWGLQYFLCHYLMSHEGNKIFEVLMDEISNNYNIDLKRNFHSYGVFVCGLDSYSGEQFLKTTNAVIFGYSDRTIENIYEDIKWVDLCFLITRYQGDTLNTAIFGEVEGNHAIRLNRESFWKKKSSFCAFGIGVRQTHNELEVQNIQTETGIKTILTLGSHFSVIDDFKIAVGILEAFFSISPCSLFLVKKKS